MQTQFETAKVNIYVFDTGDIMTASSAGGDDQVSVIYLYCGDDYDSVNWFNNQDTSNQLNGFPVMVGPGTYAPQFDTYMEYKGDQVPFNGITYWSASGKYPTLPESATKFYILGDGVDDGEEYAYVLNWL